MSGDDRSIQEDRAPPRELDARADLLSMNERLLISSVREHESAEASEERRAQLSGLLEALSEGVVIADGRGEIVMINDAARRVLGLESRSTALSVGEQLAALDLRALDNTSLASHGRPLNRALQGESFADQELILDRAGGPRRLMASGTRIMKGGKIALAILVVRDITEIRQMEQQRREFLALVSHDLRSPLNALLLLANSLSRDEQLSERAHLRVKRIENNGARIDLMLTELLEAAGLEIGRPVAPHEVCDLSQLVGAAIGRLEDERGRRILFEGTSGCFVLAELVPIERAFMNLLTNALKYSSEDVLVRVAREGSFAAVEVTDTGIGIAADTLPKLFGRYYRTGAGRERAAGLGLGLYITRLVAEAHGGRVEVRSEVAKGSTFSLFLPLHTA
jgi:NtrC-family two-component system sensor histidine kinase KinB